MAMKDALRAAARRLSLSAVITLASGVTRALDGGDILAFSLNEGADSALMPGNVISAAFSLTLNNAGGAWLPGGARLGDHSLMDATVQVTLEALDEGAWTRAPLGTFVVSKISAPEQQPQLTLTGSDSLATELAAPFEDALAYPCTLLDVWLGAVAQSRYSWTGTLPNGAAVIDRRPDWGEIPLRQAMGFIAAAAGCFVRVDRSGALALERCRRDGAEAEIAPEHYLSLRDEYETYGPVDALSITPAGAREAVTFFADGVGPSVGATLSLSRNPLFMAGAGHLSQLAEGMLAQLAGLTLTRAEFSWRGDPAVTVGTRLRLTDTRGAAREVTVTRQTLTFQNGFSATCACETPGGGSAGVLRAITPEGGVNAAALVGAIDGGLLAAGSVTAGAIRAGSVTAEKLDAGAVTAEKIAAGAITTDHLSAGAMSAVSLDALTARIGAITAQSVDTDAFSAAFASLVRAAVQRLEAGEVVADSLSAALASLVAARARTLDVDYSQIRDLSADEAIITDGVAGELYIDRLAVTSAMLLSATLGELVLKGDDDGYYRVAVMGDGTLGARPVSVTAQEIAAGQTAAGHAIVETSADIASLNAQRIKGAEAILASIFTDALTAGRVTAGQALLASATVPELYAASIRSLGDRLDISANRSITMLIGSVEAALQSADDAQAATALLRRWMRFDADGMHQGQSDSAYSTLIDDVGFHVFQLNEKIGSFARRQLAVEEVRVGRVAVSGTRCVLREAADGGMIITVEGLT